MNLILEIMPLTSRLLLKYENRKGDDAIYSIGKIENSIMEMRAVGKKVGYFFAHVEFVVISRSLSQNG